MPGFSQSDIYGFGFKLPYYRTLGPSADATVTPFVTTSGGVLLEGEYRRRFAYGGFDLWGVVTLDDSLDGHPGRGAIFADGAFRLPQGFVTDFDLEVASDDSFLQQYDYSDADRLTSFVRISRTRPTSTSSSAPSASRACATTRTPRPSPSPSRCSNYRRLIEAPLIGGRLGLDLQSLGILRDDGTNMVRAGGGIDWNRQWLLPRGVLAEGTARAVLDLYQVWNDPVQPDGFEARGMPTVAAKLRWPLVRTTGRAEHVIEPIAQVDLLRLPRRDRRAERGQPAPRVRRDQPVLAQPLPRRGPARDRPARQPRGQLHAPRPGGLVGRRDARPGDPLRAAAVLPRRRRHPRRLVRLRRRGLRRLRHRPRGGRPGAVQPRARLPAQRVRAGLGHGRAPGCRRPTSTSPRSRTIPSSGPSPTTSELSLDARYRVHPNWEVRGLWRYDIERGSNLRAGAGITYGNECAEFDLSISRRYTSSDNVPPSTSVGFSLQLAGIGEDGDEGLAAAGLRAARDLSGGKERRCGLSRERC